ncbi:hypothetical protein CBS101457_005945 [Exobasidium rhododendri]|nr:hypothetical protein CBS101457_005945 [Exobasidium rhododendri]
MLLSNPPYIPASFTSSALNRRHRILNISPEEVEDYLVTDAYPSQYKAGSRAMELLRSLAAQIEALEISCPLEEVIGEIQYQSLEEEDVKIKVELGADRRLVLLLLLEGDRNDRRKFKYDNLLPTDVVPGTWFDSIEGAIEARKSTSFQDGRRGSSRTVNDGSHEQEGQVSSEYITDADDFWAGFESDDERKSVRANGEESAAEKVGETEQTRRESGSDLKKLSTTQKQQDSNSRLALRRFARDDAIKSIIKGAWKLVQSASTGATEDGEVSEADFIRLAREALHESRSPPEVAG